MLRWLLEIIAFTIIARGVSRLIGGVMDGMRGAPSSRTPPGGSSVNASVHMVRDPVCGTYVVPDRAVTLTEGGTRVSFCSAKCRDAYRARPSRAS
jgi:hypothetical protein